MSSVDLILILPKTGFSHDEISINNDRVIYANVSLQNNKCNQQ